MMKYPKGTACKYGNKVELTCAAREAIRLYMLSIFLPAGAVFGLLTGVAGFMIKGIFEAEKTASAADTAKSVMETYATQMSRMSEDAGVARGKAEAAKTVTQDSALNAKNALETVVAAREQVESSAKTVKNLESEVQQSLTAAAEILADRLLNDDSGDMFRTELAEKLVPEVEVLRSDVRGLFLQIFHAMGPFRNVFNDLNVTSADQEHLLGYDDKWTDFKSAVERDLGGSL